jgi:hypothetical protein
LRAATLFVSLIAHGSSTRTSATSLACSWPCTLHFMIVSSPSTKQSVSGLRAAEMLSSPTSPSSWTSKLLSSTPLALGSLARSGSQARDLLTSPNQKLATIGTEGGAPPMRAPADVSMFAMCARWPDIRVLTAPTVFTTELTVSIGPCAGGHVGSQFSISVFFPLFPRCGFTGFPGRRCWWNEGTPGASPND